MVLQVQHPERIFADHANFFPVVGIEPAPFASHLAARRLRYIGS